MEGRGWGAELGVGRSEPQKVVSLKPFLPNALTHPKAGSMASVVSLQGPCLWAARPSHPWRPGSLLPMPYSGLRPAGMPSPGFIPRPAHGALWVGFGPVPKGESTGLSTNPVLPPGRQVWGQQVLWGKEQMEDAGRWSSPPEPLPVDYCDITPGRCW